ncbi:MAG: hypothetical protein LC808_10185 [Actinobacteria bacterium]|nr:hypothetical protein [Actinomycetota bacterium]
MRLHILVAVVALAFGNSCAGSDGAKSDGGDSDAGTPSATAGNVADQSALVGEWERVTTCAEMIEAFEVAGLGASAVDNMVGNGFIPGVQNAGELKDPKHPCKGAVPRKHSHFFTKDGEFGSRDWNGEQVDDGTYRVIDADTFVISKEFPDVEFHYQLEGDTIVFDPVIPKECYEFRCVWAVSMAYPGKKWTRVS